MTNPPHGPGPYPGPPQGAGPYRGGPPIPGQPPAGHPPWSWQQPAQPPWGPAPGPQQYGPPSWSQQQPTPPPWPNGPPPQRSRTGLIVTLATLLVVAIAVTAVLVVNGKADRRAGPRDVPTAPTVTSPQDRTTAVDTTKAPTSRQRTTPDRTTVPPTSAPRTTAPRTTAPRTTAPRTTAPRTTAPRTTAPRTTAPRTTAPRTTAPRTTAPRTTAPRTTAPRTEGAQPVTPRSVVALETNPLLEDPDTGLQNLVCNMPAWQASPTGAERFFRAQTSCLDAAWEPLLRYYGMPSSSPRLQFSQGTLISTPCGTKQVGIALAAYYCEGTIYVPYRGLQTDLYGNDPGVYMALFAHEYGHWVQAQSGILEASYRRLQAVGETSPAGLDMSRRTELQAQCFSGMFLGAHVERGGTITRAMYDRAWQDQGTRGDATSGTHDHGTNAHYAGWWRKGATSDRTAQCNTFAAAVGDVS